MVFASRTVCLNRSRLFGPQSRPSQPSGIPDSSDAIEVLIIMRKALRVDQKGNLRHGCHKTHVGILVEFVCYDGIHGENNFDIICLCLFHKRFNLPGTSLVKDRIANLTHVTASVWIAFFCNRKGHINLPKHSRALS